MLEEPGAAGWAALRGSPVKGISKNPKNPKKSLFSVTPAAGEGGCTRCSQLRNSALRFLNKTHKCWICCCCFSSSPVGCGAAAGAEFSAEIPTFVLCLCGFITLEILTAVASGLVR